MTELVLNVRKLAAMYNIPSYADAYLDVAWDGEQLLVFNWAQEAEDE